MKRKFFLIICTVAISSAVQAQVTNPVNRPVAKRPAQASTQLTLRGADITIAITSFASNGNNYTIDYTISNKGNMPVDASKVMLQGYVYDDKGNQVAAGCGTILAVSGQFQGGEERTGKLGCTINTSLYTNQQYVYKLLVDEKNQLTELNESNNAAQTGFAGYMEPKTEVFQPNLRLTKNTGKMGDLQLTVDTVELRVMGGSSAYMAKYTIKNIGNGAIDLRKFSLQGHVREVSATSFLPAGGHILQYEARILNPGEAYTGESPISQQLAKERNHVFQLEVKTNQQTADVQEQRITNNKGEYVFRCR